MTEDAPRAGAREWTGLVVLALPAFVIALDFTALHLAVPHLSAELRPSSTQVLWIVDVYGFMIAGLLVTMGTLGDRVGRRLLLLCGAAAFAGASALAALASSAEMLIAARALLGVTGAALLPSTLSLISNMFRDGGQRRLAIAVWSTSFLLGGAVGPLVGGALLELFWWGAVFLVAVPVMALLVALGPLLLPEFRSDDAGRADLVSVVLAMASILPVVYGIKELATAGPTPAALLPAGAGLLVGWAFLRRQRGLERPLLDPGLFASRGFTVSLGAQTAGLFVLGSMQFFVVQYLQLVLGLAPLHAGLWTLPAMAAGIVANLLVPLVARRLPAARVIAGSLAIACAGLPLIALAGPDGLALAVAGFTVLNLGLNPALVLTYDAIISSAPPERAGTAAGAAETGNELGISLGVAIAGSVLGAVYRAQVSGDALPAETPPEAAAAARDTLSGAVAAAGELPAGPGGQLLAVARDAFVHGLQVTSGVLAALLVAVIAAVALLLRDPAPAPRPDAERTAA